MSDVLDTPLTRLKAKYDASLADKDREIVDLKTQMATVRGVNELLKFEMRTLETVLQGMQKSMDEVKEHVATLKLNLPTLDL